MICAVDNIHNVGVGEGTIRKKIAEEYFRSATPGQPLPPPPPPPKKKTKKTKSNTKKKMGIGSPVFLHFWHFLHHMYRPVKDMGKTEVRGKGGRDALAHYDYKSLD